MVSQETLQRAVQRLAEQFEPQRIILFGSYARGTADEHSDVDLLVEMDHAQSTLQQALTIRKAVKRSFPLDLIVKSSREIEQRLQQNDYFLKTIMNDGQVLYDRAG